MRATPFVVAFTSLAFWAGPAAACAPAKVARGVDVLPEAWQQAVRDLVASTGSEGQPWSCQGGTVDLALRGDGATLTVTDEAGRSISRDVETPGDVVPLGEALLAKPAPAVVAPVVAPPVAPQPGPAQPDKTAPPARDRGPVVKKPFMVLNASLAPRYAGRSNVLWGGVTGAVEFPFSSWLAGGWVRYDGPAASLDRPTHVTEVCVGATFARTFEVKPVEIRAGVRPSVAIVNQSFGREREDVGRVSGRIGLEASAVFPVSSPVRALVAFDSELSPREIGEEVHRPPADQPQQPQPEFPSYTMGLGLGVEVAIR